MAIVPRLLPHSQDIEAVVSKLSASELSAFRE